MIYFLAAGLLISLGLRRNPLRSLEAVVGLRGSWLILLGFATQIGLDVAMRSSGASAPALFQLSLLPVLTAMLLNWKRPGFRLLIAGCALNIVALSLNGGRMPVSVPALELAGLAHLSDMSSSVRHQPMTGDHVAWLGDWIPILVPFGTNYVWSPGDVLLGLGIIIFLVRSSKEGGETRV
ncbi:DUF5317 domain-containing protein [Paenibacillus sp.]|uniref:DUF5317 domain-containing protein n=1 Tax=Paenibacillus sp. TaxID=58172 RepID=UPI0028114A24|nr:DUF5317 domain-containing protein [Paenibacillus sp.]